MDDFILINNVEKRDSLCSVIYHNIRELGVKLPKTKKLNKLNQSRKSFTASTQQQEEKSKIFGEPLSSVPSSYVPDYGYVPVFLLKSCEIINQHVESEGIFRKSGSLSRQKEIRVAIEEGRPLVDVNVFDMAVLIKQFFRELPEPLFLPVYMDAFVRCYQLPADKDPKAAILQLCLLLPLENIGALRFTMHMLFRVSAMAERNKMTANNLALIMAPNIMHGNKGTQKMSASEEKLLHIQTLITELLIKNWEQIGMISRSLQQQIGLMPEGYVTDDDLDGNGNNTLEESKDVSQKRRRKRSGSLTDLVNTIAHGFARLRRSTDGKGINLSLNSSQKGEISMASYQLSNETQEIPADAATPCVIKKRRASGEAIPFSATKKQTILGYLPQKSALASTPFTPSSAIKRSQADNPVLNATTPALGSKTSRKKLSLFISPGSKSKSKSNSQRSPSVKSESPPSLRSKSTKSKNIFKRLSGSRSDKVTDCSGEFLSDESLPRSVSSPTLMNSNYRPEDVPLGGVSSSESSSLQSLLSTESLLSLESRMSHDVSEQRPSSVSPDSGKGSMLSEASYVLSTSSQTTSGGNSGGSSLGESSIDISDRHPLSQGLSMLCESYMTSEEEDSIIAGHLGHPSNISRIKSASAEQLQSLPADSQLSARAHSLTSVKFNASHPHLEVSKHTQGMLTQAGYMKPSQSDSRHVPVIKKTLKQSTDQKSSFHSSAQGKKSEKTHPPSSKHRHGSHHKASGSTEQAGGAAFLSPLCEEKHSDVTEAEVDITGLDVTLLGNDAPDNDVNMSDVDVVSDVTDLDVTGCVTGGDMTDCVAVVDMTDCVTNGEVTNNITNPDAANSITDYESNGGLVNVSDMSVLTSATNNDIKNDSHVSKVFKKNNAAEVETNDIVNKQSGDTPDLTALASVVPNPPVTLTQKADRTDADSSSDVTMSSADGTMETFAAEIKLDSPCQNRASKSKSEVKGSKKTALLLSSVLDQELVHQVTIKRAETIQPRPSSALKVQQTGLVAQSVRQFSQQLQYMKEDGLVKPMVTKRGTSPIRIPTIFKQDTKSPGKVRISTSKLAMSPGNNENEAAIKTPHKLLDVSGLKPFNTPLSARHHRPQIKRLKVQYSPLKGSGKSPKMASCKMASPKATSPLKSPTNPNQS